MLLPDLDSEKKASDSYRVLARRLRPKRFSDVVGQSVFVTLIQKAFQKKKMPQGLVFSGMRGVGKTTLARLVARLFNCQNVQDVRPAGKSDSALLKEPCGTCSSCVAMDKEAHPDVMEIDAASHTGVDDIRGLLEASQYRPLLGHYKFFLLDEVHMLSKSAFNALLKTLEEPPAHVVFLLATTEVEKIPLTVLSRCVRFDLARIHPELLQNYLQETCQKEDAVVTAEALQVLIRASEGSLRDALSLLEQALLAADSQENSSKEVQEDQDKSDENRRASKDAGSKKTDQKTITEQMVRNLLGLRDPAVLAEILMCCSAGKPAEAIRDARQCYQEGGDPLMLLDQMIDLVHGLSVMAIEVRYGVRSEKNSEAFHEPSFLGQTRLATLSFQAVPSALKNLSLPFLGRFWQMLLKGREEMRGTPFPQQALEMLLIRLAYATQLPPIESLFQGKLADQPQAENQENARSSALRGEGAVVAKGGGADTVSLKAPLSESIRKTTGAAEESQEKNQAAPLEFSADQKVSGIQTPQDLFLALGKAKEGLMLAQLQHAYAIQKMVPGVLDIAQADSEGGSFAQDAKKAAADHQDISLKLRNFLKEKTQQNWVVRVQNVPGALSTHQKELKKKADVLKQFEQTSTFQKAKAVLPDLVAVGLEEA